MEVFIGQICFSIIKLFLKLIKFTGLYLTVIGYIIVFYIDDKVRKAGYSSTPTPIGIIELIIFLSFTLPVPFILIQNCIRIVKPDFSIKEWLSNIIGRKNKDVGQTYEKVDEELIGLDSGVVLGKLKRKYLVMPEDTDGHLMVIGGQGSGKSSCIAIPTLLNYNNPLFAIDIKGELANSCTNYRKRVKIFNPLDEQAPHYNPYAMLAEGNRVQNVKDIVNSIIPISPNEKDPYWKQSAQNLFIASILYCYNKKCDFPMTCEFILNMPVKSLIETLYNSDIKEVRMFVNQFVGAEDKQLASIYSTLTNEIILFATDENIMRALSKNENTISPKDLENMTDIFINISEDKLEQWKNLLNLIVNQFLKSFEKRQDRAEDKILFMIDEFARLGKIETIVNGLATLRSKGIHIMLVLQSLAQLDAIYGKDIRKIITDNCNYKVILNANDVDTQEYFSKLVGTVDKEKKSTSRNANDFSVISNRGTSKTTEEKRIIKPESFAYLEQPIVFTPKGFFRSNKVKWYEDNIFLERAEINE